VTYPTFVEIVLVVLIVDRPDAVLTTILVSKVEVVSLIFPEGLVLWKEDPRLVALRIE